MVSPTRTSFTCHDYSSMSVEDSPILGITNRPLPLGSNYISQPDFENHKVVATKRRLKLVREKVYSRGDNSKSVEILEPEIKFDRTPNRRITRSITILSDSKERDTQADKEAVKRMTQKNISGKRMIDKIDGDSSPKKKKLEFCDSPCATLSPCQTQTSQNKAYQFIIPPEDRFGGTINVFFKNEVIENLNAKLSETQKELFRSTCFGHFLGLSDIRLQNQVIHKLLLLEVRKPAIDEMWFVFDGNLLKFSIHEFCLATGLKCDGDDNTNMFKMGGENRIRDKYFKELKSVFRKDVKHTFKKLPADTPDEDVVKIGILYLISTFLFTSTQRKVVNDAMMRLVDSPYMNSFPWGKDLFQITFKYLKNALNKAQPSGGDAKGILTYRLHGFPLAFQTWIYESIPSLSRKFCRRVRYGSPHIVNWTNDDKRVSAASLEKFLFELEEIEVVQVKATEQEKLAPYYIGLCGNETSSPNHHNVPGMHILKSLPIKSKQREKPTTSKPGGFPSHNNLTPDDTYLSEAQLSQIIKEVKSEIAKLRDNQVQIIESQHEIKSDISRIEANINNNFQMVMDELSKKNYASQDNETELRSPGPSNCPVSLNKKVLASIEKSNLERRDASLSKSKSSLEVAQEREGLMKKNSASEDSSKKSSDPSSEPFSPDEIQYTEEDLILVDQIVKSARSMKGKCLDQGDSPRFHSPTLQNNLSFTSQVVVQALFAQAPEHSQIEQVTLPHTQTPINDKMGSTNRVTDINGAGQESYTRYDLFPFKVDFSEPEEDDVAAFDSWFSDGYKPGLIKFKFPPAKDAITPPFQFGPYVIASKTWWHELRQMNVYLRDSHINICFYYFRKMLRFSALKSFKCTTTDSFFGSMVRGAYRSCREDINAISNFKSLMDTARGDYAHCNTNWSEMEHVLMPIMMEKKAHWVLAHFHINDRTLYVYNPSRHTVRDRVVISDMEAFAYVIPCLMVKLKVWETSAMLVDPRIHPLDVKIMMDIPQDEHGHDCGVYVLKYAESIMCQDKCLMAQKFSLGGYRLQLAVQLYKHVCEKIIEGYETDYDNVPRNVRRQRKLSASKNV